MAIQWTEELSTGIEIIDEQHRELYRATAELHAAMRTRDLQRVPRVLDALTSFAAVHFSTEELEMAVARFPGLEEHRAAHRIFTEELAQQREQFAALGITPSLVVSLSAWLGEWLRTHLRGFDAEMARHLGGRRAAAARTSLASVRPPAVPATSDEPAYRAIDRALERWRHGGPAARHHLVPS